MKVGHKWKVATDIAVGGSQLSHDQLGQHGLSLTIFLNSVLVLDLNVDIFQKHNPRSFESKISVIELDKQRNQLPKYWRLPA